MRCLIAIFLLLCCGAPKVFGASAAETKAFKMATEVFADKLYSEAEQRFTEFTINFPKSERHAEAVLYEAEARYFQNNFDGAISLLQSQRAQADGFADQYDYWMAQSLSQSGKLEEAAGKYAELIKEFPSSPLVLEACYNQSFAYARLAQWDRVIELLSNPEGEFQKNIRSNFGDPVAVKGLLLLGEGFFVQKKFAAAEKALRQLEKLPLQAEARWRQQYLLCGVLLGEDHADAALAISSNLVKTVSNISQPEFQAKTIEIQAQILERLKRFAEAVDIYEKNLSDGLPQEFRRQSLFKTIELTLAQNKTADAINRLEKFSSQNTNDPSLDLVFVTLGELRLKQFFRFYETLEADTNAVPPNINRTNYFNLALTNFSLAINTFPQSDLLGRAYAGRGWCRWVEGKYEDSQKDFLDAVTRLPKSESQAVARFKLADAQFQLHDYTNAATNYTLVLHDYTDITSVTNTLFDQALYQLIHVGIAQNDFAMAEDAMRKILIWYPNTGFAERGLLLVGQELNKKGTTSNARNLFSEFAFKFPKSTLLPEVQLAKARTFVQEGKWPQALESFDQWIIQFPSNALIPHVEFSQALTMFQSGQETNAFNLFTNFIARYPSNNLTALAENWLGDFYANRDQSDLAEAHYKLVSMHNPSLELACRAQMNAGRSAFERQGTGFKAAKEEYFIPLIENTNTPPQFKAEAYFALGDTLYTEIIAEKLTNDFSEAISAFSAVIQKYPNSSLAPLASGKIGECCIQSWSITRNAAFLAQATNAYMDVLDVRKFPQTSMSARSQAEVGLGKVLEILGDSQEALHHYANVLYVTKGEEFDPVFVKEAGLAAAKLCEGKGQWEQAINVYERLRGAIPALTQTLEKKIAVAKEQMLQGK